MLSSAVLFVALLFCSWADGSPTGAPTEACSTLTPGHGFAAQGSYSPYITIPSKVNVNQGETIRLTFQANDATKPFKGFLAVGLDPSGGWKGPIGTMSSPTNGRLITCPSDAGITYNAATHNSNVPKINATVSWTAPTNYIGSVEFMTTYVQDVSTYWVRTYANFIVNVLNSNPTVAPPTTNFDCSNKADGNYKDPTTCSHFWTCANRRSFLMSCPTNLQYYAEMDYCDRPPVPGC